MILTMLADIEPSSAAISQFWIVAGFFLSIAASGTAIVVSIIMVASNKKQRREVTFGFEPASKDEFEKHLAWDRQEHRDLFSKIGGVERGAQNKLEAAIASGNVSREKLHGRINDLMSAIARLEGKLER